VRIDKRTFFFFSRALGRKKTARIRQKTPKTEPGEHSSRTHRVSVALTGRTHALHRQRLLGSSAPLLRSYETPLSARLLSAPLLRSYETPLSARLLSAPLLRSKLFTEASSRALGWVVSSWVARWVEIGGWAEAKSTLKVASAGFGDLGWKKKTFA
jgi:hypothetical protein